MNLSQKGIPPTVQGFFVKRTLDIKTIVPVARENGPEWRRNRHTPLRINPAGVIRDKSIHSKPHLRGLPLAGRGPLGREAKCVPVPAWDDLGYHGITWASMELHSP